MKVIRRINLCCLMFLLVSVSKFSHAEHKDFFPLNIGNNWTYEQQIMGRKNRIDYAVTKTTTYNDEQVYIVEKKLNGAPIQKEYYSVNYEGIQVAMRTQQIYNLRFSPYLSFLKFPVENGYTWRQEGVYSDQDYGISYKYKTLCKYVDAGRITVPAGTFDAVGLYMVVDSSDPFETDAVRYFAEGIGLIKEKGKKRIGDELVDSVMELKSYNIKGF